MFAALCADKICNSFNNVIAVIISPRYNIPFTKYAYFVMFIFYFFFCFPNTNRFTCKSAASLIRESLSSVTTCILQSHRVAAYKFNNSCTNAAHESNSVIFLSYLFIVHFAKPFSSECNTVCTVLCHAGHAPTPCPLFILLKL